VNTKISNVMYGALLILVIVSGTEVCAHGGGNWNDFTIDRVNNSAQSKVLELQQAVSSLIRSRTETTDWPMPELQRLRDDLLSVKEEVDEILEHYVSDGANLQLLENLRADPRMGRTAAASRSLDACIALIAHAATLENKDAFIKEFYSRGTAAYLYELLEAHKDRMALYGELTAAMEPSDRVED
jgi:hypothetical protein